MVKVSHPSTYYRRQSTYARLDIAAREERLYYRCDVPFVRSSKSVVWFPGSKLCQTRQPTRSHAVPIVPKPADPDVTRLDPSSPAMSPSPPSAAVPAPMCHAAPSPALDGQPFVADYGSPSTEVMPDAAPVNTTTTSIDVPLDIPSSVVGPDQHSPSLPNHTSNLFDPAYVDETATGSSRQHVSNNTLCRGNT
ncbi:hypothetical protein V6N11_038680 [Hibiscus sabdariffa]|uniref:Uncharacterized protein n=2 Tax=Hibiscus sabdariffa TaxID=183260 RepID=A0ABR2A5C7_9ROSI